MRTKRLCNTLALALLAAPLAAAVPAGFTDSLVAAVDSPTALAFTPDGRLIVTQQFGFVRIVQGGSLLPTPALDFYNNNRTCTDFERGFLGVAVDPNFAANNFIYLFYTYNKFPGFGCPANTAQSPVNRVSRLTLPPSNIIAPASEVVILDNIQSPNGNHNGGDLHFAPDGTLYVSVGDGGCQLTNPANCQPDNANARRRDILLGKILRINSDGTIPASNPWRLNAGSRRCGNPAGIPPGSGDCQETFSWGLRNPFRFAFRPGLSSFFINDVGQDTWEEIDEGASGADYGWNVREGHCANSSTTTCSPASPPPASMTDPVFDYEHSLVRNGINCTSITGGAFVPAGVWPAAYDNAYMYSDYVCGNVFTLTPNGGGGYTFSDFATALGNSSAVTLIFGPFGATQSLYYTTYNNGGEVHRVDYVGGTNQSPVAVGSGSPTNTAAASLTVNFSSAGSNDPDAGNTITFDWDFGDLSPHSTAANPSHLYTAIGTYFATLRVTDNLGAISNLVTIRIDVGNTPPVPVISVPTAGATFRVGQSVTLTGSATDPQDGALPAGSLSWTALLHHVDINFPGNAHTHPLLGPVTGFTAPLTCPAPEDFNATALSYVELRLTATDSRGLAAVLSRNFQPNRLNDTFATQPASGFNLTLNGQSTAPLTVVSWESYIINANAPNQTVGGLNYVFTHWSDGGVQSHAITTPATDATYRAGFVCTPLAVPSNLRIGKGGGSILNLTWNAGSGVCQSASYRVYAAATPKPAIAPGFFPLDPAYTAVGMPATNSFSYTPAAGSLYYIVVSLDANGNNGSPGSYGDP